MSGASFGERFAVSREAQRYNAVRLHRLDATRREAEAEKQEASDQRLMRLHAVRQHFQKTRKETDIASSLKMRALRTDLASVISVPTSEDVARELARLRAFDSMRDERLVIVGKNFGSFVTHEADRYGCCCTGLRLPLLSAPLRAR